MNLIGTEQGEHVEDARTYCFTRDRYTDRVNQYSRLHTPRLGCRTQRRFHRRLIEVLEPGERRVERSEMLAHSLDPYVLVDRGLVVLDRIRKEEASVHHEIVEPFDARLQQLDDGEQPRVPIAEILVLPQAGRGKQRFQPARQLDWRQQRHVLLVEPVDLFRIEDRIAAADTFERERAHQLVARTPSRTLPRDACSAVSCPVPESAARARTAARPRRSPDTTESASACWRCGRRPSPRA